MPTNKHAAMAEVLAGKGQKLLGRHAARDKKIGIDLIELGRPFTPPLNSSLKVEDRVSMLLNFAQQPEYLLLRDLRSARVVGRFSEPAIAMFHGPSLLA